MPFLVFPSNSLEGRLFTSITCSSIWITISTVVVCSSVGLGIVITIGSWLLLGCGVLLSGGGFLLGRLFTGGLSLSYWLLSLGYGLLLRHGLFSG